VIDYKFVGQGAKTGDVWARSLLEPLAPGALTPFTNSLLTEVTARAWYLYFDRLGFQPAPRSRLVRVYHGCPYVNLSISARLDAENAGVEPPHLRLDGMDRSLASWEKPGFFAGIKLGRGANKIEETLDALRRELPDMTARARAWHQRVMGMRWSQAEVLQIMEEIEQVGAATLLTYFAARHTLESAYRRLLHLLGAREVYERSALIARALGGILQGVELDMAQRVAALGKCAATESATLDWLNASEFDGWEESLPSGAFADEMRGFLAAYGHRAIGEGEIATPRWLEAPHSLFAAVRAATSGAPLSGASPAADPAPLLSAVEGKARKEVQQLVERMRRSIELQSGGLHAFSFILAGTRRWALAAGREATVDHRLMAIDDVFFYEVEEVKEMMTGEWNISDRSGIHATAGERRAAYEQWRQADSVDLLWGDREALAAESGLPASGGVASGAVVATSDLSSLAAGSVIACTVAESSVAILLPACVAFVAAQGSPIDPLAACARTLGHPGVVALGADMTTFPSRLCVDGNLGRVTTI
jgi:hypothetical protein